jgi:hypothetical protein
LALCLNKCHCEKDDFTGKENLGLLLKEKKISVNTHSEHSRIMVRVHGISNLTGIITVMGEIKPKLDELAGLETLKVENKITASISLLIRIIGGHFAEFEKLLSTYSKLIGTAEPPVEMEYKCNLTFPEITKEVMEAIRDEICVLLDNIDPNSVKFTKKGDNLKEFLNVLYLILEIVTDNKEQLREREKIVESLENSQISDALLTQLSMVNCIPEGELQKEYLVGCNKDKKGLICELDVATFRTSESYTVLTPINYKNVQLVAQHVDELFVLNSANHIGILDCGKYEKIPYNPDDEQVLLDSYCKYRNYDNECMLSITNNNYDGNLKHCNFTSETPELITRTQEGILVMNHDKNLIIKEITDARNPKLILSNKTPVLIQTPQPLVVQSSELEMTIYPSKTRVERRITYSRLTEDFIDKMVASAIKHDFLSDIGISDYIVLCMAIIITVVLPITCGLCITCVKSTEMYHRFKESRAGKALKNVSEQHKNFKENTRIIRQGLFRQDESRK